MLEQEIIQALSTPGMTEAAGCVIGGYGVKKLYEDFASPTVKQAGLLGAKIFSAISYKKFILGKSMYISNLERLGLINATYLEWFNDTNAYSSLISLPQIKDDEVKCKKSGHSFEILKGILLLTPLGKDFTDICIGDIE